MKKLFCTSILAVLIASVTAVRAQNNPEEYLGLPGDNLNLYAVMDLFQKSETLEAFERDLNAEDTRINNLDLNGDNMVDYITVSDFPDGDDHTIVLRAALNRDEYQDVAVFTVQKFRNGSVQIQLIGDEELYGRNYIVEPIYAETPNPGYKGRTVYRDNVTVVTTTYYEVAAWPVIRFIYHPRYIVWHSSWYWGYYPVYWHPWSPFYWHYYYGYHYNWYDHYYGHYRYCDYYRYAHYNDHYYHSIRQHSANVSHRISAGNYKQTYSRPEQRRDGEAMYARTHGSRDTDTRSYGSAPASDRRSSPAVTSRSANGQVAGQNSGEARRSASTVNDRSVARPSSEQSAATTRRAPVTTRSASTQSAPSGQRSTSAATQRSASSRPATVQRSEPSASRQQSSVQRSQPSASTQQSSVQRSQPSASRQQSTVQRSEPSASRQQSSVQRSQPSASRQQSSVQRSQPSASRQQSSVQRSQPSASRQQASVQRSQSSRSSAPAASSSRSSSQSRSSGSVSQKSSNSSRGSDNSRSSRR